MLSRIIAHLQDLFQLPCNRIEVHSCTTFSFSYVKRLSMCEKAKCVVGVTRESPSPCFVFKCNVLMSGFCATYIHASLNKRNPVGLSNEVPFFMLWCKRKTGLCCFECVCLMMLRKSVACYLLTVRFKAQSSLNWLNSKDNQKFHINSRFIHSKKITAKSEVLKCL